MVYLSVKLDHVAALRQVRRGGKHPIPAQSAALAEMAGADGITIHMRRDRRHIREKDLFLLKEVVGTRLTVEIAPTEENLSRILEARPYMVTFMPEGEKEITTQAGLTLEEEFETVEEMTRLAQEAGIRVCLHLEPDTDIIKRASRVGVDAVKLHTAIYASARTEEDGLNELSRIERAARAATKADLMVIAGQSLDYQNLPPLAKLGVIDEFTMGQAVIARAVMVGMHQAVRDVLDIIRKDGAHPGL
jgi:pyridoxine 5-phosphate synthase